MKTSQRSLSAVYLATIIAIGLVLALSAQGRSAQPADAPQYALQPASSPIQLTPLAEIGPWPVASRLIGYRGRLWFATSVKGRNHNSADIWSLDPAGGEPRYERHLFSQDAGVPVVHNGLLYWPYEDALMVSAQGVIEVTDGQSWQPLSISGPTIYHTSEVVNWNDTLVTVTGARSTSLHQSRNAGQTWDTLYTHPETRTHINRFKDMVVFQGQLYGILRDTKKRRLARWTGSALEDEARWPRYRYMNGLTVHKGRLFGLVGRGANREIWAFDGTKARQIGPTGRFVDIASDGHQLWAVLRDGQLWSSANGVDWAEHKRLTGGRPSSIEVVDGALYVGGTSNNDKAMVWGPQTHTISGTDAPASSALPRQWPLAATQQVDWVALGNRIDSLLANADSYRNQNRDDLQSAIETALQNGAPKGFFRDRLNADFPDLNIQTFSGENVSPRDLAAITMMRAMASARHDDVPTAYLTRPWTAKPNAVEKYFAPQMAALRAVAMSGQNDRETLDTLIKRLRYKEDPDWLRAQVIGTLSAVSGQRFGYNLAAWEAWHKAQYVQRKYN